MPLKQASVSVTNNALVIRIPWDAVGILGSRISKKRKLTARDVLEMVDAGRLAHRAGKTRSIRSLKELIS